MNREVLEVLGASITCFFWGFKLTTWTSLMPYKKVEFLSNVSFHKTIEPLRSTIGHCSLILIKDDKNIGKVAINGLS